MALESLADAVEQELLCSICHDLMNIPKVLECLHSFCKDCLLRWINHSPTNNFYCPICKHPHQKRQDGVDNYKTNFTLCNLLEARKIHQAEEKTTGYIIKCENGIDENPAITRCIDCECYLCTSCSDQHTKIKATRQHRVIRISEINEDIRKLHYKRYCDEHEGEELKMYCLTCEEVICRDCTMVNHKDHKFDFIKNIKGDLENDIKGHLGKVENKLQEFTKHTIYIDKVASDSAENIKECHRVIRQFFDGYRENLGRVQAMLHQQLIDAGGEMSKRLDVERETVELSKAKLENAKLFTNQLLDKGIPVDIAMMSKQTCSRLEQLQHENWERGSVKPSQWGFVANEMNPLESKVHGGISPTEIGVEDLAQPIQGTNQFKVNLSPEINSTNSVVVATVTLTEKGERLPGVEVKRETAHLWNVQYQINDDGLYEIRVTVNGVEAQGSPFKRKWLSQLPKGTRVCRGKDWKWGDQDGNDKQHGEIVGWAGEVGASDNWVKVKWDNQCQNNYRWGAEGAYDLMILIEPQKNTYTI